MKNILKDGVFQLGDTFDWEKSAPAIIDVSNYESKLSRVNKVKLVVVEIYPCHILCRETTAPYLKRCLDYGLLYSKGIIKETDFRVPFAR